MWQTASRIVKTIIVDTFISVYIVSQCAFYGTLGINGLKEQVIMSTGKQHWHCQKEEQLCPQQPS